MLAITPTGSRRIIDVCPAIYSPAIAPCCQRTAPAKKRKQSTIAGISSPRAALIGLPQFSASSAAKASASGSLRAAARGLGGLPAVRPQGGERGRGRVSARGGGGGGGAPPPPPPRDEPGGRCL